MLGIFCWSATITQPEKMANSGMTENTLDSGTARNAISMGFPPGIAGEGPILPPFSRAMIPVASHHSSKGTLVKTRTIITSIIAAIAAVVLGISAASANGYGPYDIQNNNNNSLYLHAHSDGGVLTNSSAGIQDWAIVPDLTGNSGDYQIVLQGTHWCANWHSSDNNFYLDGCDGTQLSQQFLFRGTGTAGQVWYLSDDCVTSGNLLGFLTAFDTSDGSVIDCEGSGQGNRAVWNNLDS